MVKGPGTAGRVDIEARQVPAGSASVSERHGESVPGSQGWGPNQFDWVHGIVVDSHGAVYAADTYGQRIQKFVPPSGGATQGRND